jgi:hypothetical protein
LSAKCLKNVRSVSPARSAISATVVSSNEHFTWMAGFLALDSPASSALTRELLGWQPTQPGLIADVDQGHYFRQAGVAAA